MFSCCPVPCECLCYVRGTSKTVIKKKLILLCKSLVCDPGFIAYNLLTQDFDSEVLGKFPFAGKGSSRGVWLQGCSGYRVRFLTQKGIGAADCCGCSQASGRGIFLEGL